MVFHARIETRSEITIRLSKKCRFVVTYSSRQRMRFSTTNNQEGMT